MKIRSLAIGALGICLPFSGFAAEASWYGAIMPGTSRFELAAPSIAFGGPVYASDNQGNATNISLGYRINHFLGLELGYLDFGKAQRSVGWPIDIMGVCVLGFISPCNGRVQQKIEAKAYTAAVIGSLPLTKTFEVFAKVGIANVESRITSSQASITAESSQNVRKIIYGVGGRYLLNEQWVFRVEGNRLEEIGQVSDRLSVNSYSAGIEYRF